MPDSSRHAFSHEVLAREMGAIVLAPTGNKPLAQFSRIGIRRLNLLSKVILVAKRFEEWEPAVEHNGKRQLAGGPTK